MISGLYSRQSNSDAPFTSETIRLDVDGSFPQMAASGTGFSGLQTRAHWVARPLVKTVTPLGDEWSGPIFLKFGGGGLVPHSSVVFTFVQGNLRATFRGPGLADRVRDFTFTSPHFHEVAIEYDAEQGVQRALDYDTGSHPNRPGALATETLTLDTVFQRAGFSVQRTGQDTTVPSTGSGANQRWSSAEMHDAMQVHFSRLASLPASQRDRARWALWTFFAKRFQEDPGGTDGSTGGIMFDSIGAAERQGTAIFRDSFIAQAPAGDPALDAWRRRMAFWTAAHEMGHAFNLAHAWEKNFGVPWIPQEAGFHLKTFMNYPFFYENGPQSNGDANTIRFFRDFMFRFSDDELLFLRHAPERFVIMGGDRFGSNHAFEQARISPAPPFTLELRVNRPVPEFEFMEPVVIELKLTNTTSQPVLVPSRILRTHDKLVVSVRKRRGDAELHEPFAHYFFQDEASVLGPGESIYGSMFVSAGNQGWSIAGPGYYDIEACLHLENEDILANPLAIRVAPPRSRDEEYIGQDYFSGDVARVLAFDGSLALTRANDTLREVAGKLESSAAAIHARVALDLPRSRAFKLLETGAEKYRIREVEPEEACIRGLSATLGDRAISARAAESLGHIDYRYYVERFSEGLGVQKRSPEAAAVSQCMRDTLAGRKVAPRVLSDIDAYRKAWGGAAETSAAQKPKARGRKR